VSRFIYCYAECRYAECHYAECHYAECRYAECRGALHLGRLQPFVLVKKAVAYPNGLSFQGPVLKNFLQL
jgi:hypothetical protein